MTNRTKEVKRIPKPQILSEKRICKVTNKKPEEDFIYNAFLLCETQRDADAKHYESRICQLFPQPLGEQYLTEFIFQYLDRSQETYNQGKLSNQDRAKHIVELMRGTTKPQPLDDKELREALLTKEEREKCVPSEEELTEYLATPDDAVATELRKRLPETDFRELGLLILYNEKCIKAQQKKAFALLQPKIEEARRQERERIRKGMKEAFDTLIKAPVPDFISRAMRIKLYGEVIELALKGEE